MIRDPQRLAWPLGLRPVVAADGMFLADLYASTREDVAALALPADERQQLLALQFRAQNEHYRRQFPRAQASVILWRDEPVGSLSVDRGASEIRLIDIALLPEYRGRGLGRAVLRRLLRVAAACGKPLRLRVDPFNPALRLYRRLGFTTIGTEDTGLHMEWRPTGSGA